MTMVDHEPKTTSRRFVSWAFVVDLILATIPAGDAAIDYDDGRVTFFVYFTVLAALRLADRWAVGRSADKGKRTALRIKVKIAIIVLAEMIVVVSAMEACDAALEYCRRVFF